jgi:hypothetical protein
LPYFKKHGLEKKEEMGKAYPLKLKKNNNSTREKKKE